MMINWSIASIHRSSRFYKQPNKFDPHRFDGHESNTLQDDHWFGFGVGPRACPAVRWTFVAMKIFIVQLVKKYKIVKSDKTVEMDEVKLVFRPPFAMAPTKDLLVRFEKRFL